MPGVSSGVSAFGLALVDIRTSNPEATAQQIAAVGGQVVGSWPVDSMMRANVPVALEMMRSPNAGARLMVRARALLSPCASCTWTEKVKLPEDVRGRELRYLVSSAKAPIAVRQGWASFEVKSLGEHEVIVIL